MKVPFVVNVNGNGEAKGLADGYKNYLTGRGYSGLTPQSNMQDYVLSVAEDSMDQYNR